MSPALKIKKVNPEVGRLFNQKQSEFALTDEQMTGRCLYRMFNEAVLCLKEGVIQSTQDGDIGAVFGMGFPPFLGGPFHHMQKMGLTNIIAQMNQYQSQFGEGFQPCDALLTYAQEGGFPVAEAVQTFEKTA